MNYLVLNGSPRGKNSKTMKLANKFINGIKKEDKQANIEIFNLAEFDIEQCRACFLCWKNQHLAVFTNEKCIISAEKNLKGQKDIMSELFDKFLNAENIIMVTPMHFFSISSYMQIFLERLLPMVKRYYYENARVPKDNNKYILPDFNEKNVTIISSASNYFDGAWNGVESQLDLICEHYEKIFSVTPIATDMESKKFFDELFKKVEIAGIEFAKDGKFSINTKNHLFQAMKGPFYDEKN
jgi:FMN-dependent NADH-azoreductase